jgi:DNA-binding transcriptional LysR family regulator
MEMHQIRYFLCVAKTLNFTHAADECHVAQPSLSRAIKKLEEELGGDLFRRERGLTHLTELGRLMLPLLTQCYDSAVAAKSLATSYRRGTCAPLCLALSHTVNLQLLIQPLTELVKAFPGLELKFFRGVASEVGEQLKLGEAELGIACPLPDPWDRLESWVLFTEGFELAVPKTHPFALRNSLTLAQIAQARLLPRSYDEQAESLERILDEHGLTLDVHDRIGSDHDLMALLAANVGVSIMPHSARTSDAVRFLPLEDLELIRPVVLYAVAGRQRSPAAAGLLRLLRSADWSMILGTEHCAPNATPA